MSTITPTQLVPTLTPVGRVPYRLSVDQYEDMIRKGIFSKRDGSSSSKGSWWRR